MKLKAYRVYGKYTVDKKHMKWSTFKKDVVGKDEKEAIERVLSTLSGTYGIKRKYIRIEKVEEIQPSDSEDPRVLYYFGV